MMRHQSDSVSRPFLGTGEERTTAAPADRDRVLFLKPAIPSRLAALWWAPQPRNRAMPKPSPPLLSPSEGDEDPIWGDLFGFIRRPMPNPSPPADTSASASPPQRKPANKPRKPSTRRVPPVGAGNP